MLNQRQYADLYVKTASPTVAALRELGLPVEVARPEELLAHRLNDRQIVSVVSFLREATDSSLLRSAASGSDEHADEASVYASVTELFARALIGERGEYDYSVLTDLYDRTLPGTGHRNSLRSLRTAIVFVIIKWSKAMVLEARLWLELKVHTESIEYSDRCGFATALSRIDSPLVHDFVISAMNTVPGLVYSAVGRVGTIDDVAWLEAEAECRSGDEGRWFASAAEAVSKRVEGRRR